jgi:hypothetical protein
LAFRIFLSLPSPSTKRTKWFAKRALSAAVLWAVGVPSLLALRWHYAPPAAANHAAGKGEAGQKPGLALALAIVLGLLAAAVWLARPLDVHDQPPPAYPCPAGRCL